MTAKEMIEKLQKVPPETVVFWDDYVEGNSCEVQRFSC